MIEREARGRIALLRLAHGKANAFDSEFASTLRDTLDEIERSSFAALVVTGSGSIFSAGVDLKRVLEGGPEYVREFVPAFVATLERLFFFPKPVVAAVNGHAIAGGCIIASTCDYRFMARGTGRIGVPELRVGVPFPPLALEVMRCVVPHPRLAELLYCGETFEADAAREFGLVDEVVVPERLLEVAVRMAERLAALPDPAFHVSKSQVRHPVREFLDRNSDRLDRTVLALWTAPETRAAIERYVSATLK